MVEEAYYKLLNDVLRGYNRSTPSKILRLRTNQIFVFGTDRNGTQKYGAAGVAAKNFGAKPGVVDGMTGMCYALPTMGFSEEELSHAVIRFEQFVRTNMQFTYLVTPVGCGHAGFDVATVANMFKGLLGLVNVMLPETFLKVYRTECHQFISSQKETDILVQDTSDDIGNILVYYDERVHDIIRYLFENSIPFNQDGGFSITDVDGRVIAEAELGIETEKIVFLPFNSQSENAFKNNGYTICDPIEYVNSKLNKRCLSD